MAITYKSGRTVYEGVVLGTSAESVQRWFDESYYVRTVLVWTGSEIKKVYDGDPEVANPDHRFATVSVDAPEDVVEAALQYVYNVSYPQGVTNYLDKFQEDATRIQRGDDVEVVKGRKVKVGTRGFVFWVGTNQWGTSVGIENEVTGERQFTAFTNVRKVNVPEADADDVLLAAADHAAAVTRQYAATLEFGRTQQPVVAGIYSHALQYASQAYKLVPGGAV